MALGCLEFLFCHPCVLLWLIPTFVLHLNEGINKVDHMVTVLSLSEENQPHNTGRSSAEFLHIGNSSPSGNQLYLPDSWGLNILSYTAWQSSCLHLYSESMIWMNDSGIILTRFQSKFMTYFNTGPLSNYSIYPKPWFQVVKMEKGAVLLPGNMTATYGT